MELWPYEHAVTLLPAVVRDIFFVLLARYRYVLAHRLLYKRVHT